MADMRKMQLGQIVDFCATYNERMEKAEKKQRREEKYGKKRRATQNDINSFLG